MDIEQPGQVRQVLELSVLPNDLSGETHPVEHVPEHYSHHFPLLKIEDHALAVLFRSVRGILRCIFRSRRFCGCGFRVAGFRFRADLVAIGRLWCVLGSGGREDGDGFKRGVYKADRFVPETEIG